MKATNAIAAAGFVVRSGRESVMQSRMLVQLATVLCLLAPAAAAQSETALQRAQREGYIRVGFPNQIPYAFANEKGQLTGADAEVAKLVIAHMGIKEMDGVLTEFAALIPGLKAKRFDIVLAMFINPQRCAQVAFSEPIYRIGQGIVVKKGNPHAIKSWGDIVKNDKLSIATMAGAVQNSYLKKLNVTEERVISLPDGPSALTAVSTGRADVFLISNLSARRMLQAAGAGSDLELVADTPDPIIDGKAGRGYDGFAFRTEDHELHAAFDKALAEVKASTHFLAAMEPFGFTKDNLPDAKTEDLCK
jgi:polar amino acid transport system substrate-binding protein